MFLTKIQRLYKKFTIHQLEKNVVYLICNIFSCNAVVFVNRLMLCKAVM